MQSVAVVLLLVSQVTYGQVFTCKDITLDKCKLPEGEIITSVKATNAGNCQAFCGVYEECKTFVFSKQIATAENCDLVSMDIIEYLSTCQELGGVKGVDFDDCVDLSEPECKGYSSGGCSFTGTVLETLPGILDYGRCALSADLRGATYWVYNIETDECILYDNNAIRSCNIERGPNC